MISLTMLPKSTSWLRLTLAKNGSTNSAGGGHTSSRNMEPASDARGLWKEGAKDGGEEEEVRVCVLRMVVGALRSLSSW